MRTVGRIQSEAFPENPAQSGVYSFRVLNHSGVRLQAYVNGRYVRVGWVFMTGCTARQYCHGNSGSYRVDQKYSM